MQTLTPEQQREAIKARTAEILSDQGIFEGEQAPAPANPAPAPAPGAAKKSGFFK